MPCLSGSRLFVSACVVPGLTFINTKGINYCAFKIKSMAAALDIKASEIISSVLLCERLIQ